MGIFAALDAMDNAAADNRKALEAEVARLTEIIERVRLSLSWVAGSAGKFGSLTLFLEDYDDFPGSKRLQDRVDLVRRAESSMSVALEVLNETPLPTLSVCPENAGES